MGIQGRWIESALILNRPPVSGMCEFPAAEIEFGARCNRPMANGALFPRSPFNVSHDSLLHGFSSGLSVLLSAVDNGRFSTTSGHLGTQFDGYVIQLLPRPLCRQKSKWCALLPPLDWMYLGFIFVKIYTFIKLNISAYPGTFRNVCRLPDWIVDFISNFLFHHFPRCCRSSNIKKKTLLFWLVKLFHFV